MGADQCHRDEARKGHVKRPSQRVGPRQSRVSRQTLGSARRTWVRGLSDGSVTPRSPPLESLRKIGPRQMVIPLTGTEPGVQGRIQAHGSTVILGAFAGGVSRHGGEGVGPVAEGAGEDGRFRVRKIALSEPAQGRGGGALARRAFWVLFVAHKKYHIAIVKGL